MSYKSLLFCPDEKAAHVVTQVLSELEFTVEIAVEPFATVKKLTDEHFDALVVDCHNEQDASLLFKAARNSAHNHSSLSVAVVEGQAGVAKAFRIGANLVLTKPINVEQSKSTLRVARGLLRKNETRAAGPAASAAASSPASESLSTDTAPAPSPFVSKPSAASFQPAVPKPAVPNPAAAAIVSPEPHIAAAATVPYSALELEKDPTPQTEAADLAVLESLPQIAAKHTPELPSPVAAAHAEPIAASTAGQAAAAAPALEKKVLEIKSAGASPMVTNQPIVKEETTHVVETPAVIPTFSSLDSPSAREDGSGKGFFKIAVALVVIGAAAYFGWQKLHPLQYLHRANTEAVSGTESSTSSSSTSQATAAPVTTPSEIVSTAEPTAHTEPSQPPATEIPNIIAAPATNHSTPEEIELQEMPMSRDAKVPPATKLQMTHPALVVKSGPAKLNNKSQVTAPPALELGTSPNSSVTLSELVPTNAPLPKPALGTVRVSQGVSQGLLLKKVAPVYPPMALQLRKEGVVQLLASISKTGDITNVKVLSGDGMLSKAAADAVLRWKYRPYLLNGEPIEIETQISIVFRTPQ